MDYKRLYEKYKSKYLNLKKIKNMKGGDIGSCIGGIYYLHNELVKDYIIDLKPIEKINHYIIDTEKGLAEPKMCNGEIATRFFDFFELPLENTIESRNIFLNKWCIMLKNFLEERQKEGWVIDMKIMNEINDNLRVVNIIYEEKKYLCVVRIDGFSNFYKTATKCLKKYDVNLVQDDTFVFEQNGNKVKISFGGLNFNEDIYAYSNLKISEAVASSIVREHMQPIIPNNAVGEPVRVVRADRAVRADGADGSPTKEFIFKLPNKTEVKLKISIGNCNEFITNVIKKIFPMGTTQEVKLIFEGKVINDEYFDRFIQEYNKTSINVVIREPVRVDGEPVRAVNIIYEGKKYLCVVRIDGFSNFYETATECLKKYGVNLVQDDTFVFKQNEKNVRISFGELDFNEDIYAYSNLKISVAVASEAVRADEAVCGLFTNFELNEELKVLKRNVKESFFVLKKDEITTQTLEERNANFSKSNRIFGLENNNSINVFIEKRGKYVISPPYEEVIESKNFEIHIKPNDFIIPVCHEGMNRSQVMFLVANVLKSCIVPKEQNYRVSLPHGAETGFDPHPAIPDIYSDDGDDNPVYRYLHGIMFPITDKRKDWLQDVFFKIFGMDKQKRIGHRIGGEDIDTTNLNPIAGIPLEQVRLARIDQRSKMDTLLYNTDNLRKCCGVDGRVIFITFYRASKIILERLLENSNDFTNIVIVALPYPDTISRAGGSEQIDKCKEEMGKINATEAMITENCTRNMINERELKTVFNFYASLLKTEPRYNLEP
jgi:hypothetical protein